MVRYSDDGRIVLTLDAGGTGLKFSAIQGNRLIVAPFSVPTEAHDLGRCLTNIASGFEQVRQQVPSTPAAISFSFPGPADYSAGIIGDLPNLPAFRGGVALGPYLEDRFGLPVFVNNDGNLFTYGESIAGFLPWVNRLLEQAGSRKRYRNLFGITLGTGLGGGVVVNGDMLTGDNFAGGEAWLLRHKLEPKRNAEEGACRRAVRAVYADESGIQIDMAPEPRRIFEIGMGQQPGNRPAARAAYRVLGEVAGDVVAQALTLIDGLAVIGGGISQAHPLFWKPLMNAVNAVFESDGAGLRRVIPRAFNLENDSEREQFLKGDRKWIQVPCSARQVEYDPLDRTAVGLTRLGTSEAVAVGAYAFALNRLDA